jgi:hypothetical protein
MYVPAQPPLSRHTWRSTQVRLRDLTSPTGGGDLELP